MKILYKSVCHIDASGRMVLPAPLRKMLKLVANDQLSITVTENGILLNKSN